MQVVVLPHDANRGGRACGLAYRCIGTGPRERPASPTVIWRLAKGAPKQGHLWKGVTRGYPFCDQQKSRSNERPALNAYAIRDANPAPVIATDTGSIPELRRGVKESHRTLKIKGCRRKLAHSQRSGLRLLPSRARMNFAC